MKKLALVCSGSETRDLAPWDDDSFDIWVLNEAANSKWCKRWDAVFQMHKPEIYKGHNTKDVSHWQWLQKKHGKPVYMQEVDPLVPDSVRFPIEAALELAESNYLAATVCDCIALALLQDRPEMHIWGLELSHSEYQYQAECVRYWVGLARGRLGSGKMIMHSGLHLFDAPLYGYEGNFIFGADYFSERVKFLDNEWSAHEKNALNVKKAIERAIDKFDAGKLPDLVSNYQVALQNTGTSAGALAEAQRYEKFGDRFADRGGFEFAGATAQKDAEEKKILMLGYVKLIEYIANAWIQSKSDTAKTQLLRFIDEYAKLSEAYGAMLGMYNENISYILRYDRMVQANGGLK